MSNLKQKLSVLREEQSEIKKSRTNVFTQVSQLQASIRKKVNIINSACIF
jgi:hypothetical protein